MRLLKARATPALIATIIVVAAFFSVRAHEHDSRHLTPMTAAAVHTPVLSARRVPDLLIRRVGDGRIAKRLANTMADPALASSRGQTCLTVRQSGRDIYAQAATQPLLPASNLKLLTAAAVLSRIDGKGINNLSQVVIAGEAWQQWSRHRTGQNPWRPGVDDIASHLGLVDDWLRREFGLR